MAKHKFASISLTVQDTAISSKFSTHRVSKKCTLGNFQKNFPLPTYGGHFEFSNFCQKWKNTNLLISLTVQNRVILLKFSTHRVSKKCTLGNFQKKFPLPKNGGHFEFLPKIEKQKFASVSLTVQDRVISSKFSTQPMQKGMKLKYFTCILINI